MSKRFARDLFRQNRFLLFAALTARETCKETLLRKASDAHVVSFGKKVGGLRPSDTSIYACSNWLWYSLW